MDVHYEALLKSSVELHNSLNIDIIIPYLLRDNLLTNIPYQIQVRKSRGDKINFLISSLPTKGINWLGRFVDILRSTTNGIARDKVAAKFEQEPANLDIGKYHIALL